uniref:Secreted protein n=1 Tax=Oryza punctata TaxID=4537 RepID=A0A0E0JZZ4_ORYPU
MALLMLRAALSPAIALSTIDGVVSVSVSVAAASDYDRVGAAKRARDHLLPRSEEHDADADARGWSSAVMERSLALRRRRGCASSSCCSSSFRRAATVVVVQEQGFRREEAAAAAAAASPLIY